MKRTQRGTRLVAAATALLLLLALTTVALLQSGPGERAPGLAPGFTRIDAEYQQATEQFVSQTSALPSADLRTALRLYDLVLEAATEARSALLRLDSVEETRLPITRMTRALEVQELALDRAITAARNRDQVGATAASEQFQAGVLAYLAARTAMVSALASCGSRCR